jgi:hypothetical protein
MIGSNVNLDTAGEIVNGDLIVLNRNGDSILKIGFNGRNVKIGNTVASPPSDTTVNIMGFDKLQFFDNIPINGTIRSFERIESSLMIGKADTIATIRTIGTIRITAPAVTIGKNGVGDNFRTFQPTQIVGMIVAIVGIPADPLKRSDAMIGRTDTIGQNRKMLTSGVSLNTGISDKTGMGVRNGTHRIILTSENVVGAVAGGHPRPLLNNTLRAGIVK